jgi:hypothetical protein
VLEGILREIQQREREKKLGKMKKLKTLRPTGKENAKDILAPCQISIKLHAKILLVFLMLDIYPVFTKKSARHFKTGGKMLSDSIKTNLACDMDNGFLFIGTS